MAGFPGFVVMTTKPPLPDQTEIRVATDGNAYTNAPLTREGREGGSAERCGRKEKARVRTYTGGGRETVRREKSETLSSPSENYPRARVSSNRLVLPRSFHNSRRLAVVCCTEHVAPAILNPFEERSRVPGATTLRRLSLLHPCQ